MNSIINVANYIICYLKKSFSQEGEDLLLSEYFNSKIKGYYIDIGAHHPFRFSNTYIFYRRGWRGINIDATPGSMDLFKKYRSRDINIEVPVSNNNKLINYYIFNETALNSFSDKLSRYRDTKTKYKIKKVIKLKPQKLSEILDKYINPNKKIDFMSIDVEGYEYNVLLSNNWKKYIPTYLLIEILTKNDEQIVKNKIYKYLKNKGYAVIARTGRTILFKKTKK
jgi:FkbM family methyltransferase